MTFSPENPPELVIFDNDGVLIDSEIIAATTAAETLAEYGYHMSVDEVMHAFIGMSGAAMKAEMANRGIVVDEHYEARATERFLAAVETQLKGIEGAIDLVSAIKQANIPACVCSNATHDWVVGTHQKVGLSQVFNPLHYFHRDLVENPKPAPYMHLMALDNFGVSADKALVIEDSVIGASGGIAAGIEVWGFLGATGVPPERDTDLLAAGVTKTFESLSDIRQALLNI